MISCDELSEKIDVKKSGTSDEVHDMILDDNGSGNLLEWTNNTLLIFS